MTKRDTAIWSTTREMREGLEKRGAEFVQQAREVRLFHRSGRVMNGTLTSVDDDVRYVDFRPVGARETTRYPIEDISQFTLPDRSFSHSFRGRPQ